ncbi:MAG: hypothetical protein QG623_341 [Patescibacteria group bacterium]|nr:hypothetical protein [Patescibacteria group bacterium]
MQNTSTIQKPNTPNRKRGNNRRLSSRIQNIKLGKKQILALALGIALLIVSISQLERLYNEGTFFGYQIKDNKSKEESDSRKANSGSLVGGSVSKDNKKSIACDTFPSDKISKILESEVERISGFVEDKTEPNLISSCIYRTKGDSDNSRSVAILMREFKDEDTAKKTFTSISQAKSGEEVKKLGDQAYFNNNSNQLTVRKGKEVYTITVAGKNSSKEQNKELTISIVKIVL